MPIGVDCCTGRGERRIRGDGVRRAGTAALDFVLDAGRRLGRAGASPNDETDSSYDSESDAALEIGDVATLFLAMGLNRASACGAALRIGRGSNTGGTMGVAGWSRCERRSAD